VEIQDPATAHVMTDLSVCFVRYIDVENVLTLFKVIKPHLKKISDHTLEKKSYKGKLLFLFSCFSFATFSPPFLFVSVTPHLQVSRSLCQKAPHRSQTYPAR
jgi:hypothetical protein